MLKILLILALIFVLMNSIFHFISISTLMSMLALPFTKNAANSKPDDATLATQNLYQFKLHSLIDNEEIDFSKYRGKKVIILNVASECGFTPQYADWQKFNELHGKDVIVLGFPSNDFGSQEPGDSKQISAFCTKNYGVTFQMFEKITVKGENKHPLYKWLSTKELNGWNDKEPSWNFCKYVINEKGELTHFFGSKVLPTDQVFLDAIKA